MADFTVTQEKFNALVRFLPAFQSPSFDPGEMRKMERNPNGSFSFPYTVLSDQATSFVQAAYDNGWIVGSFDWPSWAGSEEAERLRDDENALARATPEQIARLLTVVIRQDRFCEGVLLDAFNSGLILRIVRRIDALLKEAQSG